MIKYKPNFLLNQAADPLPGYTNDEAQTDTLDVYGSAVAPVGTSAPGIVGTDHVII